MMADVNGGLHIGSSTGGGDPSTEMLPTVSDEEGYAHVDIRQAC